MRERSEMNLPTGSGSSFLEVVGVFGFTIMHKITKEVRRGIIENVFFLNRLKFK
jgi:hypothetical protein